MQPSPLDKAMRRCVALQVRIIYLEANGLYGSERWHRTKIAYIQALRKYWAAGGDLFLLPDTARRPAAT
jgi:hypothetical protein